MDFMPISEGFDDATTELFRWALKNDPVAMEAAEMLWSLLHVWDDLVDLDKPVSSVAISGAFWAALVGLYRNAFWLEFAPVLRPLLEQGIYDWLDANRFEAEGNAEVAFGLRSGTLPVFIKMAELVGGLEWGRQVSHRMRKEIMDDFEDYKDGLGLQA